MWHKQVRLSTRIAAALVLGLAQAASSAATTSTVDHKGTSSMGRLVAVAHRKPFVDEGGLTPPLLASLDKDLLAWPDQHNQFSRSSQWSVVAKPTTADETARFGRPLPQPSTGSLFFATSMLLGFFLLRRTPHQ